MSIKTATLNGVTTIEIARPEKKNALTIAMYQAMTDALNAARADDAVRAVLITGQPGVFTSGNDIEDFMARPPGQGSHMMESPVARFMRALFEFDKPANLYYEASVAGGIPIIKVLREGLIGNRITRLFGIVNGTCNFILTRMKDDGADFADVLAEAQRLGYAEAPPDLDVDGHDAAHKTGILASLAHGFWVNPKQIYTEGIRSITPQDIKFAGKLGYTIRLLGCVKATANEELRVSNARQARVGKFAIRNSQFAIQVSVYPALVPNSHVLANVNGVFNAVLVRGDVVGDTLYYGQGAGQDATASAVLSDLADAALDLKCGTKNRIPPFVPHERDGAVLPMDEVVSRYYVRLTVEDRPGVFAKIAGILAKAKIGISSIIQPEGHDGETVPVILMIHDAPNAVMRRALAAVAKLSVVKSAPVMIRVESFE